MTTMTQMRQAIRSGQLDELLDVMEQEIRERRRQLDLNKKRDTFAQRLAKWDADKSRPHRRAPSFTK